MIFFAQLFGDFETNLHIIFQKSKEILALAEAVAYLPIASTKSRDLSHYTVLLHGRVGRRAVIERVIALCLAVLRSLRIIGAN